MLTISLDWLAGTFKETADENGEFRDGLKQWIHRYASFGAVIPTPAHNGYTACTTDQNGVSIAWNADRQEMGYHAVVSGSALRNIIANNGVSPDEILKDFVHAGASVTRLDLALDAQDVEIDITGIFRVLEVQGNRGTAKTWYRLEGQNKGETLYIGSRQSEKFIRIYNKAAESKLQDKLWTRFEIETKGMVARSVAVSLNRTRDWYSVFTTVAMAMVRPNGPSDYQQFFTLEAVPIGLAKLSKQTDTERWIATQIIAAIARHYIDNPNSEAIQRLRDTLDLIDKQRKE